MSNVCVQHYKKLSRSVRVGILGSLIVVVLLFQFFYLISFSKDATTSISDTCVAQPYGNFTLTVRSYTNRSSAEFLKGPGLTFNPQQQSSTAVCEWYVNSGTNHFPHEMEQLYGCWSWWNSHPAGTTLILYRHPWAGMWGWGDVLRWRQALWSYRAMAYCREFVAMLQHTFGVNLVSDEKVLSNAVRKGGHIVFGGYAYRWHSPMDAKDLAKGVFSFLNLTTPASVCGNGVPRVAILNRRSESKRSILNIEDVTAELNVALESELQSAVSVTYFEDSTFKEQISFFSSYDLIISPHGAQLVSIPYMPACSAVLEIFPKNYYHHLFFGSLLESSGLKQYTLYPSDDSKEDIPLAHMTRGDRRKWREVNLCPAKANVVEAVQQMIVDWHQCCRDKGKN